MSVSCEISSVSVHVNQMYELSPLSSLVYYSTQIDEMPMNGQYKNPYLKVMTAKSNDYTYSGGSTLMRVLCCTLLHWN